MNQFELTPDLQTEVESLDELHRNLLRFANRAVELLEHARPEAIGAALQELAEYAQYVFAAEEQWMQSIAFGDLSAHRISHNEVRLEICELVDAARKPDAETRVPIQLSSVVGGLLLAHFRTYDQKLASHARQHLKPHQIRLCDSATLRRAGVLVSEGIDEAAPITATESVH